MKFRKAAVLLAGPLLATSAAFAADANVHPIDVKHSRAQFSVQHVFVERATGTVPILSGTVTLGESTLPTSVAATLDATRITTDEPDRDAALESPDWFDAKRYPTWDFKSTSIEPGSAGAFSVEGQLTLHGVTRPVTLQVTTTRPLPHPAYHAVAHVDRHQFGMSITHLDGAIGSDVTLAIDVQLE